MPRTCKKTTGEAPAVKSTAKPETPVEEIIIQAGGSEWSVADLKEKAIAAYVAEGHRRGNIKQMTLYVKPEEHMAYYVMNDKPGGSVVLE